MNEKEDKEFAVNNLANKSHLNASKLNLIDQKVSSIWSQFLFRP
jgi:hypothetical protein